MQLLHAEDECLVMYVKHPEAGRFKVPAYDEKSRSYPMEWRDFVVMVEGIQESPLQHLKWLRAERNVYIVDTNYPILLVAGCILEMEGAAILR